MTITDLGDNHRALFAACSKTGRTTFARPATAAPAGSSAP